MPSITDILSSAGVVPWAGSSGSTSSGTSTGGGSNIYDLLGLGLGAGSSILTAILGNKASGKQADAISGAMDRATAASLAQAAQNRADVAPWLNAGKLSLGELLYRMGLAPRAGTSMTTGPTFTHQGASALPLKNNGEFEQSGITDAAGDPMGVVPLWAIERGYHFPNGEEKNMPYSPYFNGGSPGGQALNGDTGQPVSDGQFGSLVAPFQFTHDDPSFQWRLGNGLKAIERSAAARGTTFSGATLKALDRYAGGEASQEYNNAFNRDQVTKTGDYNRYAGIAGYGPQVAGQVSSANTSLTNNGNALGLQAGGLIGDARASGYASTANAATSISDLLRQYLLQQGGRV